MKPYRGRELTQREGFEVYSRLPQHWQEVLQLFHPNDLVVSYGSPHFRPLWFVLVNQWQTDRLRLLLEIPGFDVNQKTADGRSYLEMVWCPCRETRSFLPLLLSAGFDARHTSIIDLHYYGAAGRWWVRAYKALYDAGCTYSPTKWAPFAPLVLYAGSCLRLRQKRCIVFMHCVWRRGGGKDMGRLIARKVFFSI